MSHSRNIWAIEKNAGRKAGGSPFISVRANHGGKTLPSDVNFKTRQVTSSCWRVAPTKRSTSFISCWRIEAASAWPTDWMQAIMRVSPYSDSV